MSLARGWLIRASAGCCLLAAPLGAQFQQRPVFRAGVDLVIVDVQVVDRDGEPIADLQPADFEVQIDRRGRQVVSAELIRISSAPSAAAPVPPGTAAPEVAGAPAPAAGRTFVLAVDESSFKPNHALTFMETARRFIRNLSPADRIGVFKYPINPPSIELTTDHEAVVASLGKVMGTFLEPRTEHHISVSEVVDIVAGDREALEQVVRRECSRSEWSICRQHLIPAEAKEKATAYEIQVARSVAGLRTLLDGLRTLDGRKTLVLMSGGLPAGDRIGGRPDVNGLITTIGEHAARSNVNLYVLHMDTSFLDMFSVTGRAQAQSAMRDSGVLGLGLERFTGTAGGALIRVEGGTGDYAFDRVLRETSAYYLLGIVPEERDRDGRPHFIHVRVKRRGATVRSRAMVTIPAPGGN